MAVKQEQIEFLKFRKALDRALRDNDILEVDYEYDLGKKDVVDDSRSLLKHLEEMDASLRKLREMMR